MSASIGSEPPPGFRPAAVGRGARFEGLLTFERDARVDGELRGEVVGKGTLEVGPEARIQARIQVGALVTQGSVEGEIVARQRVELLPGARVTGSISTPRLAVADGALLEARVAMAHRKDPGGESAAA